MGSFFPVPTVYAQQRLSRSGNEAALRRIIQQQRKITETSNKLEMKKLNQVLIILDDLADVPQFKKLTRLRPEGVPVALHHVRQR